tara:strand:- start:164 stop:502 length:339 start_codon:yes stop_codon:yes gene_type:complete
VADADAGAAEDLRAVEDIVAHLSLDAAHLLPTAVEISVRQALLLALHSGYSAGEFLVEFEVFFEVSAKWMIFHLSIDGRFTKILAHLDRLTQSDCAHAQPQETFEQIVDCDI